VQLQVHHNGSALAANVYCSSFLPQISGVFCNSGDPNVQRQKDTITFTLILVFRRKRGMPCAESILGGLAGWIVRHTPSLRLEERKRLPVCLAAKKESFSPTQATDQHLLDSHASVGDPHGHDNQVDNGVWREQFTLPNKRSGHWKQSNLA
jgi:hypothetical protein